MVQVARDMSAICSTLKRVGRYSQPCAVGIRKIGVSVPRFAYHLPYNCNNRFTKTRCRSQEETEPHPVERACDSRFDSTKFPLLQNEDSSTEHMYYLDQNNSRWTVPLIGGLASLGAVETGYLALSSLLHTDVVCPLGDEGSSCMNILNSSYAMLWDAVPLSLVGCLTYTAVAGMALMLMGSQPASLQASDSGPTIARSNEFLKKGLLGGSTLLVSASSYLLYILTTAFPGDVCPWCLSSAALSFGIGGLAVITARKDELEDVAMPGMGLVAATVLFLSIGLGNPDASMAGSRITRLDYKDPEVTTESSSASIELVRRLKDAGARMYGAFWCGHCYEQKQILGKEAMKEFPYVECFPDGWSPGVEMAPACKSAGLNGFPTWVIGDTRLEGEQSIDTLESVLNKIQK